MHESYQTTVEKNHVNVAVFRMGGGGEDWEIFCRDFPSPRIFVSAFYARFKDCSMAKEF